MDSKEFEDKLFPEPTLDDADGDEELFGHLKKAREVLRKFFEVNQKTDWEVEYESDGVTLWTRAHETSSFRYCKRYMEVNVDMMELIKLMRDPDASKLTDEKLKEFEYCYDYNSSSHILKLRAQGNLVVSDRALVVFTTLQQLPNGSYAIINFSIDTDKTQVDSSCVLQSINFIQI